MLNYTDVQLDEIAIHHVGAQSHNEKLELSENMIAVDEPMLYDRVSSFFFSSFKEPRYYRFRALAHELSNNHLYQIAADIFQDPATLAAKSQDIARWLYDRSLHPNIKSGDLFVFYFEDVLVGDEMLSGLGLIKAENKTPFLQVTVEDGVAALHHELGFSVGKVDKGCLIFNTEHSDGYRVLSIDRSNSSEAHFWVDDFLQVDEIPDDYYQTKNYIDMTKSFVQDRMKPEYEADVLEEVGVMNRAQDYFTVTESFSDQAYADHVFPQRELSTAFLEYRQDYENEQGVSLNPDFDVSTAAVQKNNRVFRSVLKLDKNFHIYIHGNRDMIERGTDANGRKFYKVYFEEEA